jgi:hypothetical protein
MKFLAAAQQYLTVLIAMQWAYMVCVFGYAKWGFLGAAAGLVASPALLPFSPFTAWMHSEAAAVYAFYGLLLAWGTSIGLTRLLEPRIYDERGNRIA